MKERFCILLVDDDPKDIHLLSVLLQESGYVVESAMNGQEALAWINRKLFDLILLDVMLPDIDGYDICKRLKSIPTTRSIPVIFLTAKTDPASVIKGFQLGAVDYLTKPFQREELLARVKIHLALVEQQQTLDKYADLLEEKNRELAQKNKQLQEANASKDAFFSIIAHDVKSPLTGFLSFAQILRHVQNIGHEHFQELVTHFQQSAERLLALLDNLLTWAQIQRGTIEFMPQRINLQCSACFARMPNRKILRWTMRFLRTYGWRQTPISLKRFCAICSPMRSNLRHPADESSFGRSATTPPSRSW